MRHHIYPEEYRMNNINNKLSHEYPGGFTHHPDYDNLPYVIQGHVTPEEYAWMGNAGRKKLYEDICYPDCEED